MFQKQEGGTSKAPSNSRQWSRFRNPRVVRVSSTFGGKDRHSKVCTIRGLRDRRIRLSVPTATQLYDLQDRLGLGQPSKVIDWLLDATKEDIDKLPPLPFPMGFDHLQFHHHTIFNRQETLKSASSYSLGLVPFLNKDESKELVVRENDGREKGKSVPASEQKGQSSFSALIPNYYPSSWFPNLLNDGSTVAFSPYCHLDPSSLSLSQIGSHNPLLQNEGFMNSKAKNVQPVRQLFFYPQASISSSFPTFSPLVTSQPREEDNSIKNLLNSFASNRSATPFHHQMIINALNPGFGDTQRNDENQREGHDMDASRGSYSWRSGFS